MTKPEFKRVRIGDLVRVVTPLYGYQIDPTVKIINHSGLGPHTGKVVALGPDVAYVEFYLSSGASARCLHTYCEIESRVRPPLKGKL